MESTDFPYLESFLFLEKLASDEIFDEVVTDLLAAKSAPMGLYLAGLKELIPAAEPEEALTQTMAALAFATSATDSFLEVARSLWGMNNLAALDETLPPLAYRPAALSQARIQRIYRLQLQAQQAHSCPLTHVLLRLHLAKRAEAHPSLSEEGLSLRSYAAILLQSA